MNNAKIKILTEGIEWYINRKGY